MIVICQEWIDSNIEEVNTVTGVKEVKEGQCSQFIISLSEPQGEEEDE